MNKHILQECLRGEMSVDQVQIKSGLSTLWVRWEDIRADHDTDQKDTVELRINRKILSRKLGLYCVWLGWAWGEGRLEMFRESSKCIYEVKDPTFDSTEDFRAVMCLGSVACVTCTPKNNCHYLLHFQNLYIWLSHYFNKVDTFLTFRHVWTINANIIRHTSSVNSLSTFDHFFRYCRVFLHWRKLAINCEHHGPCTEFINFMPCYCRKHKLGEHGFTRRQVQHNLCKHWLREEKGLLRVRLELVNIT